MIGLEVGPQATVQGDKTITFPAGIKCTKKCNSCNGEPRKIAKFLDGVARDVKSNRHYRDSIYQRH